LSIWLTSVEVSQHQPLGCGSLLPAGCEGGAVTTERAHMRTSKNNTQRYLGRILAAGAVAMSALLLTSTVVAADESSPATTESSTTSAYVYWSYWSGTENSEWAFGQKGAGDVTPADGSVEGWAYSAGSDGSISQPPRIAPDFAQICGNTDPVEGKKQVAVVVDFGKTTVAPAGSTPPAPDYDCVTADPSANGLQVLGLAQPVRSTPEGFVCGITNYPATGCGEQVSLTAVTSEEEVPASAPDASTGDSAGVPTWVPFAIGGLVIVALAGAAVAVSRRRNG
jgi:hypothetical protein